MTFVDIVWKWMADRELMHWPLYSYNNMFVEF